MLLDYLAEFGEASRAEINKLLWDKLSIALDDGQKENRVRNLLKKMRETGQIKNIGERKTPRWVVQGGEDGDS